MSWWNNSSKFKVKYPIYQIEDTLLSNGIISKEQLDNAKETQNKEGINLEDAIVKLGYLIYSEILKCSATQYNLPVIDLDKVNISDEIIATLPVQFIKKHHVIPQR